MTSRPRLLVADDHPAMLSSLIGLLAGEFEIVAAVADGLAVVAAADRFEPDLLVLDIAMPGLSGIAAAAQLKASGSTAKVRLCHESQQSRVRQRFARAGDGRLRREGSARGGSSPRRSLRPRRANLHLAVRRPIARIEPTFGSGSEITSWDPPTPDTPAVGTAVAPGASRRSASCRRRSGSSPPRRHRSSDRSRTRCRTRHPSRRSSCPPGSWPRQDP